ncbi:unnamed protein product [Cylicocyclus nassatus]|uniref:Nuclear pore localisation protein NPL4 C-terminal domain-containing protein n=1 Tax=Cylicocyclus nassatus TaxID=53992 RepID=A0AA36GDY3_CYLNA|nr:unnamed protein product [Cylicocyclus nassatus]
MTAFTFGSGELFPLDENEIRKRKEQQISMKENGYEAAPNQIASLLQRPDHLEKLPQMRKRDDKKKNSFFLSPEECITAGYLQSKHPNITDYCSDRHFDSEFVTVLASGDEQEQVNFHG